MACNVSQLLDRRADCAKVGGSNGIGRSTFEVANQAVGVPQIDKGAAEDVIGHELRDCCRRDVQRVRLRPGLRTRTDGRFTGGG